MFGVPPDEQQSYHQQRPATRIIDAAGNRRDRYGYAKRCYRKALELNSGVTICTTVFRAY